MSNKNLAGNKNTTQTNHKPKQSNQNTQPLMQNNSIKKEPPHSLTWKPTEKKSKI